MHLPKHTKNSHPKLLTSSHRPPPASLNLPIRNKFRVAQIPERAKNQIPIKFMKSFFYLTALALIPIAIASAQSVDDLPTIGEKSQDSMDKIMERRDTKEAEKKAEEKAKVETAKALDTTAEARKAAGPEKVTLHHIKPGGSLSAISEEAYGRTRYWRILKLYNKVDPSKLQVGQEIKAPDIKWLLASSGLQERYPKAVANILSTKQIITEIQEKKTTLTEEDLTKVKELAGLISEAQTLLMKKTPGVTGRPNATFNQLQTVRAHLLHIANKTKKGRTDPHSLVHEHISNSIVYGVLWAQSGFK